MDNIDRDYIVNVAKQHKTFKEISEFLKATNPGVRGFSERSVKRYCSKHDIRLRINQQKIENIVASAVKEVLTTYCMFDQVRVDHGREFFLMLGMQEYLANIRGDQLSLPYQQTESKRNLPIERFWVEVNGRVNYPIKSILVDMDNSLIIDMDNNIHKFCVSFVTCKVANFGLQTLVRAWNCHPIPGRGVPLNIKEMTTRYPPVQQSNVPDTATAMQIYNQTYQGRISEPNQFGDDPLKDHPQFLANRNREFNEICNIEQIYNDVVNENDRSFRHAVHCFIDITERYNALL
ncbi:uncharacterized protein LOC130623656 isoform X2 [Hydractinia symbiolongicarpus]|uniref:uncharacterized protein LOC130623656 isoform X2 n=1 Tax=Hydractinia symbiolongicarpus TaxID=13093 RepID=UPI00254B7D78|nr:uncharacterized protein LOC130623656 isoform X2 [Hydractinia symbiolongicarpus]